MLFPELSIFSASSIRITLFFERKFIYFSLSFSQLVHYESEPAILARSALPRAAHRLLKLVGHVLDRTVTNTL